MGRGVSVALALLAAGIGGCIPVPSLHPFVGEGQAIAVPEVVGEWGESASAFRITLEREASYTLRSLDPADSSSRFRVRFVRLHGRLFADVTMEPGSNPGGDPRPFLWPMHTAFRVDVAGDSLRMAFLDDDWLEQALDRRQVKLRHERPDGEIVLTETTPGLQALLGRIANVDAAFDTSAKYARRH